MDEYLDMLIEDSAKAAKAALVYSMFPRYTKDSKRIIPALKKLDVDVLDSSIGLLASASQKQLDYIHYALTLSAVSEAHSDRAALLYSASFASLHEAFSVQDESYFDWYMEMRNVCRYMESRTEAAADLQTEISIARGVLVALKTHTFSPLSEASGFQWLGSRHDDLLEIAPALVERQSSDPILIQHLIEESHAALSRGVL